MADRSRWARWARWAVALAMLGAAACGGGASAASRPNVVLICLDTVRADHLGCYGYDRRPTTPALDELASRSTVFRDTWATAGWTKPSVPSFLTGTYPLQHGVYRGSSKDEAGVVSDVLPDAATTLAEVFQDAGYQTGAFVKNAQLRRGLGFEQGFDVYRDEAGDARSIRWWATDWLGDRDRQRPFFLYLHFLDAHWPYAVPDEYAGMFAGADEVEAFRSRDWRRLRDDINHGRVALGQEELDALVALYDGSIRYIDDQLGRFFEVLEREGLAEDTVVCVMSDHGEEFLEHGRIGHGHGLHETLLAVPWILHVPGRPGVVREEPCSLVDLFPTLLSAAGITGGEPEGHDLLRSEPAEPSLFAEHLEPGSYQRSWREDARKVVRRLSLERDRRAADDLAAVLVPGTRWEARLDEELRVVRLRPRDADASEPTELKGPLGPGAATAFSINGFDVDVPEGLELYGDGARDGLQLGRMAKALGAAGDVGTFEPLRMKVYAQDEDLEREIRGPVQGFEDGKVRIGALWLTLSGEVEVDVDRERSRFDRERVAGVLSDDPAAIAGLETETLAFDLIADPGEHAPEPIEGDPSTDAWERRSRFLFERRFWSGEDSAELSAEDLERLRAIGYAE